MLPALSRRASTLPQSMRGFTMRLSVVSTGAVAVLTLPAVLLTRPVTLAVFGHRYEAAVLPAQVLVAVTPLVLLHFVTWSVLVAERRERWVTAAAAGGAMVAVLLTSWIILRPDATVTAAATALAIAAATVALVVGAMRTTGRVALTAAVAGASVE